LKRGTDAALSIDIVTPWPPTLAKSGRPTCIRGPVRSWEFSGARARRWSWTIRSLHGVLRRSAAGGVLRRGRLRLRRLSTAVSCRADRCGHGGRRGGCRQSDANLLERSEEHTSELQSRFDLVCRLLLEK